MDRRGRPALDVKRREPITCYMTVEQKQAVEDVRVQEGYDSVSKYVLDLLLSNTDIQDAMRSNAVTRFADETFDDA